MSKFSEITSGEFDLTHLWKASIGDDEGTAEGELIFCSSVEFPTSIVSLENDILNVGIPMLKDPDVSITILCPRNRNTSFNEEFFKKWCDNNYDEETGASNIFCNTKYLSIQRLTYKQSIENAEWKPSFAGYVVPIAMPTFNGESTPNFRQMTIQFKKIWGSGTQQSQPKPQQSNQTPNLGFA